MLCFAFPICRASHVTERRIHQHDHSRVQTVDGKEKSSQGVEDAEDGLTMLEEGEETEMSEEVIRKDSKTLEELIKKVSSIREKHGAWSNLHLFTVKQVR
jgi:hypothetical protein